MENNFQFNQPIQPVSVPAASGKPLRKYLIIGGSIFAVLVIGLSVFFLATRDPGQNVDDEEAVVEYAGESSRLTDGIRILIDYGLTYDQYKQVYDAINKKLDRVDPDSKYFDYVAGSLAFSEGSATNTDLSDAEREAILAELAAKGDATSETFGPEGGVKEESAHDEKQQLPIVSFKIRSNLDKEYTIKFDSSLGATDMKIEIYDAEGNKI